MASRPTTIPQLDTTKANRTIPAGSKVTSGYSTNDLFPAPSANYLHGWAGDWLEWLQERSEDGSTPTTDLTLRGLDALTVTGDGGDLTLLGGDGGGTSGDGGDIILSPGGVTSGTLGRLIVNAPAVFSDGVSVGHLATPADDSLSVGDAGFRMLYASSTIVRLEFDSGDGDYIRYDRTGEEMALAIATVQHLRVTTTGVIVRDGLTVGHGTAPVDDIASIGDADFNLEYVSATDVRLNFDTDAYVGWDRTAKLLSLYLEGGLGYTFDQDELDLLANDLVNGGSGEFTGLSVGSTTPAVSANTVKVGDANFQMFYDGTDSYVIFDTDNDKFRYDRSEDVLEFKIGNVRNTRLDVNGLSALSTRVTSTDDSPADGTEAYQRTIWNSVVCAGWFITGVDGTVSSFGGWNVSGASQSGGDSPTYNITHDAAIDDDAVVIANYGTGSFTGFTGVPTVLGSMSSNAVRIAVYDSADQTQAELISCRVQFVVMGRTTVTTPAL